MHREQKIKAINSIVSDDLGWAEKMNDREQKCSNVIAADLFAEAVKFLITSCYTDGEWSTVKNYWDYSREQAKIALS